MSDDTETKTEELQNGVNAVTKPATTDGGAPQKPVARSRFGRPVARDVSGDDVEDDDDAMTNDADQIEAAQKAADALAEERRKAELREKLAATGKKANEALNKGNLSLGPAQPEQPAVNKTQAILAAQREVERRFPNMSEKDKDELVKQMVLNPNMQLPSTPPSSSSVINAADKFGGKVPLNPASHGNIAPTARLSDRLSPTNGQENFGDQEIDMSQVQQNNNQTRQQDDNNKTIQMSDAMMQARMDEANRQQAIKDNLNLNKSYIDAAISKLSAEKAAKIQELDAILNDPNASDIDKEMAANQKAAIEKSFINSIKAFENIFYDASQEANSMLATQSNGVAKPQRAGALTSFLNNLFGGRSQNKSIKVNSYHDRITQVEAEYNASIAANRNRLVEFAQNTENLYNSARNFEMKMAQANEKFSKTAEFKKIKSAIEAISGTTGIPVNDVFAQLYNRQPVAHVAKEAIETLRKANKEIFANSTNPDIVEIKKLISEANKEIPNIEKMTSNVGASLDKIVNNHPSKEGINPDRLSRHITESARPFTDSGNLDPSDTEGKLAAAQKRINEMLANMFNAMMAKLARFFGINVQRGPSNVAQPEAVAAEPGM